MPRVMAAEFCQCWHHKQLWLHICKCWNTDSNRGKPKFCFSRQIIKHIKVCCCFSSTTGKLCSWKENTQNASWIASIALFLDNLILCWLICVVRTVLSFKLSCFTGCGIKTLFYSLHQANAFLFLKDRKSAQVQRETQISCSAKAFIKGKEPKTGRWMSSGTSNKRQVGQDSVTRLRLNTQELEARLEMSPCGPAA